MLNSKFDINSPEWIDRVFENRNKSYGAYDLRKNYAVNLFRAFAITVLFIAAIVIVAWFLMDKQPDSVAMHKGPVDVVNKPVKIDGEGAIEKDKKKNTKASVPGNDHTNDGKPLTEHDVDIKPMPVGGAEAWKVFLENNLHYPAEARAQRISGNVLMSFIVERDGRLSNITVEQGAGHGFDQEALRVLNLSPAWAPGSQSGQTVRVKYRLPISFNIQRR